MESEWIDGMKVFLHVHGINLYRIYTLSPKQLVAEILHHLESRKPYKLWDKLHINWFAAFVFRWKFPFPPRAAYRISTQRSKAWASKGGQRSGPWIQVCFWLILMKWWIITKFPGQLDDLVGCKMSSNHFLNSQASEGTFDPLDTVSSLFCHIYTVQVETEQTESGWKDAFHLVDMTMPGLLRTSPKWIKTQMVRFKIIDLSPHLQLESRWCCFPFAGL